MDSDIIYWILQIGIPVLAALITFIITYAVRGKSIEEAREEALGVRGTLVDVLAFFDPEKPYCDTNIEALNLIAEHPYSYCLEADEKDLIFEGLSTEEIASLESIIAGYEADMCVDYNLHTSLGTWRIYYGTPTETVE